MLLRFFVNHEFEPSVGEFSLSVPNESTRAIPGRTVDGCHEGLERGIAR